MREWSLTPNDPVSLRIAADARRTTPNYVNDQIWELSLQEGDPPAVSMESSYGLRARRMRIFPGFSLEGGVVINPDQFARKPVVRLLFPDYLRLDCQPFEEVEAQLEYWVRESHLLQGRIQLTNLVNTSVSLGVRLYAQLRIGEDGEPMGEWQYKGVTTLAGRASDLAPLVFITGGARVDQSIYPSLVVECSLAAREESSLYWAHVGLGDHPSSFEFARAAVAIPWDAEIAKLEHSNRSFVDVETGNLEWDAAFLTAQNIAVGAYLGPTKSLPHPSFVLSRTTQRGYSPQGDGSDYAHHWDGQSALQAYAHFPQLIPVAPESAKGVIRNFLSVQDPSGFIDWRPGLGGQRRGYLSVPILATLSWMIYEGTDDVEFLGEVFPGLMNFVDVWFGEDNDRDGDGYPEWENTIQMGFEDCPTFTLWRRWGQGLDTKVVESPDLAAYLVRECESLVRIAQLLDNPDPIELLEERITKLKEAVERSWEGTAGIYHFVDRDTHLAGEGELLGSGEGEFILELDRKFDQPVRIVVRCYGDETLSHSAQIQLHGSGAGGRPGVEKLRERHFHWFWGIGTATSGKTFVELERVEVKGLGGAFTTEISTANFTREDIGLLLPLWAHIPLGERALELIERTVLDEDRFYRANGISDCSALDPAYSLAWEEGAIGIDMARNTMLGEALLAYGYTDQAVDLLERLMSMAITALKEDGAFRQIYDPDDRKWSGEKDHLSGIAPLGLFLKIIGIKLISPSKFAVRGTNPFPWSVSVRWRGITIDCHQELTRVTFPDGNSIEVSGDDQQMIERISS